MEISLSDILSSAIEYKRITGIYFLIYMGEVVYVGQSTINVHGRVHTHATTEGKKFDKYHWIECDPVDLDDTEAELIVRLNPLYNYTIPRNSKWITMEGLKRMFNTGAHSLKRHIKNNEIRGTNGYYKISDFAGMEENP